MLASLAKSSLLALTGLTLIACASNSVGTEGGQESEIVEQEAAPTGTFVREESLLDTLGEDGVSMIAAMHEDNPKALESIVARTYLVLRTDEKFLGQIVFECATTCGDRAQDIIPALNMLTQWGEDGLKFWGTYGIAQDGEKQIISYKLANDAPAAAQAEKAALESPDELSWNGTVLKLTGQTGSEYHLSRASNGRCRDNSDCSNQSLPALSCDGEQYACDGNVCRASAGCE